MIRWPSTWRACRCCWCAGRAGRSTASSTPAGIAAHGCSHQAWLGRFGADLRHWGYDGWAPFHQREFANAANWKIPFEGNLETYHFQYAHRNTIAGLFYDNLLMADHDRQHQRIFLPKRSIEIHARSSLHMGVSIGTALRGFSQ
ncbi:MAG TPA: SRPBCC family protein [Rhodoferax sp.]|nr:SRPBCC family protein [Rhodoferax sp.]